MQSRNYSILNKIILLWIKYTLFSIDSNCGNMTQRQTINTNIDMSTKRLRGSSQDRKIKCHPIRTHFLTPSWPVFALIPSIRFLSRATGNAFISLTMHYPLSASTLPLWNISGLFVLFFSLLSKYWSCFLIFSGIDWLSPLLTSPCLPYIILICK